MSEHTPTPWALMRSWPDKIVSASQINKGLGGSVFEGDDRERYALVIATAEANVYSGFAHEMPITIRNANAAFIVKAVNNHDALVDCLRSIAEMSDAEPRQPDDADWRFRCLSAIEVAKRVLGVVEPSGGRGK